VTWAKIKIIFTSLLLIKMRSGMKQQLKIKHSTLKS